MKSVLYSIQPWHVANILSGDKDLEIRLRIPRLKPPYKAYIYCTRGILRKPGDYLFINYEKKPVFGEPHLKRCCNGKVVAEFICDYTRDFPRLTGEGPVFADGYAITDKELERACLTENQLWRYGEGKDLHGIHISNLKVYDEPKALGEFNFACDKDPGMDCTLCAELGLLQCYPITRAPQSWCYVEELSG